MSLEVYKDLTVLPVSPVPADGGKAISDNFRSLADWGPQSKWAQSATPTAAEDGAHYYYPGSQWSQVVSGGQSRVFVCRSNGTSAAVWDELLVNPSWYALLAGVSGGQTLNGGTASGNNLTLSSTSNAIKGKILFGSLAAYDEANTRLGIGTTSPAATLHLASGETHSAWGTSGIGLRIDAATYTDSSSSGPTPVNFNAVHSLGTPILAASNTVHYQDAITLYIAGAPTAGTNVTFTHGFALLVAAGDGYFGGNLLVGTTTQTGQLTVEQDETNPTAISYAAYCNNNATLTTDNGQSFIGFCGRSVATVSDGATATSAYSAIGVWGTGVAVGAGDVNCIVGVLGTSTHDGSGTVTNGCSFYAVGASKEIHDAVLTNAFGFFAADQANGSSVNAGFAGSVNTGDNKYNLYMSGGAQNYLNGKLGCGATNSSPAAQLDVLATTEQLRLGYDLTSHYCSFTVDSTGSLTIDPNGSGVVAIPAPINSTITQTTLSGTTAGNIVWSQPLQGSAVKLFVAHASGYENNTATNQTITFSKAFTTTPSIISNTTGLTVTVSTTTLTITAPNNTTTFTGNLIVMGY